MTISPTTPSSDSGAGTRGGAEYSWLWVLCLLGLDYFSTLAYQPSITFHETDLLGPLATAAVVLLTLFGALPVYCYLAGRSPGGQGSLGLLERLIRGWRGKTLVLVLLGFAATDFTMLKSLSVADAAVHVLNKQDGARLQSANQLVFWMRDCTEEYCGPEYAAHISTQLVVTILLGVISTIFWLLLRRGFTRNVIVLAVPLVAIYVLMTALIVGGGLWKLYEHPDLVDDWIEKVRDGQFSMRGARHSELGWGMIAVFSFLALPKLALGLSGFEMSMILMPQVKGVPGEQPPLTRIRNTRLVLVTAAGIMSALLLGSILVTTLLIPRAEFEFSDGMEARDGLANDRALAYLAHGGPTMLKDEPILPICGNAFGTLYDIVTVLILCLAGTSVMTALGVLLPLVLTQFGMQFRWADRWSALLMAFAAINLLVTVYFQANVEDQRGAYATGVLVMIACAATVSAFEKWIAFRHATGLIRRAIGLVNVSYFGAVAAVFLTVMLAVALNSASGLGISLLFLAAILTMSIVSRAWRADELRTVGFTFKDTQSAFLWNSLRLHDFPVLVPLRPGRDVHDQKEREIRAAHNLSAEADVVFLEIHIDDPSDFFQSLLVEVVHEDSRYRIKVSNSVSIAHAIAAVALEMSRSSKPPGLHFGWPELSALSASWSYLAFGEGNIPWKVRELIERAEPDPMKRPRVIVG